MKMTKKEYKQFIDKYKLLGQIEQERKKKVPISLDFMDAIFSFADSSIQTHHLKSKLDIKIILTLIGLEPLLRIWINICKNIIAISIVEAKS